MRPPFSLLMSTALCLGACACHSGKNTDKKDKDSSKYSIDSAGHQQKEAAAIDPSIYDRDSIILSKLKKSFADTTIPYQGLWVSEHYLNEIREGKALHESADTETKCIVIPHRTLQVTRFIFGFHDGGASLVFVKKGATFYPCFLYDGLYVDSLNPVAEGKLKIGHDFYIRVGEKDSASSDWGILEKLLFAGQYMRSGGSGMAVFAKNGKIQGLDSLGYYDPVVDYADLVTKVDHIRLGRDKHHYNDYGLRLLGDTMMIYTIDCLNYVDGECVLDTLGRQIYTLVKVK